MTTLNGFIRSANASYKRAARAQQRYAREYAKREKENLKRQLLANNANAVTTYNVYIDALLSVHKECNEKLHWNNFVSEPEPQAPILKQDRESMAQFFYNKYKPSLFDKLFKQEKRRREKLLKKVEVGKNEDRRIYDELFTSYQNDLEDWKKIQSITKGVLEKDPRAYKEAFEFFDPFSQIKELGSRLSFNFSEDHINIDLHVNSEEVVPDYILSLTSTGKLSNKKMSNSGFNELYQDYVCGCVLRVARETFALIPVNYAFIKAYGNLLNSSTGHIESRPILSVKFAEDGLSSLNFKNIDCSDAVSRFPHEMKFSKAGGFSALEAL